jgi:hypothetical protein
MAGGETIHPRRDVSPLHSPSRLARCSARLFRAPITVPHFSFT